MRWTIYLEGGPRRVNHAAVAIGSRIYSFGGYCSDEINRKEPIDVHVLNTETYRWQKVSLLDSRKRKMPVSNNFTDSSKVNSSAIHENASNIFSVIDRQQPTTSSSHQFCRFSLAEVHPLNQLRNFRPPLYEDSSDDIPNIIQRRRAATVDNGSIANDMYNNISRITQTHPQLQQIQNFNNEMEIMVPNNNLLAMDLDAMDVDEFLNVEDNDMLSDIDELANEAYDEDDDDLNFIDGDNEAEDYDDFDFNYHNIDGAQIQRRQRRHLNSLLVPNNLLRMDNVRDSQRTQKLMSEVPYQRYGHTVVAFNGKAYLWGGRSDDFGTSSVLHEFDPVLCKWSIVKCNGGSVPPSRDGHTAIVYGENMYIFGGFEEQFHRFSQETFAFNFTTSTWQLLRTEGKAPQHRDFHTACVLEGRMYVFGGRSDEAGQHHSSKDKYCDVLKYLDLKKLCWVEVRATGDAPCGRRSHSVWVYNNKMYMFGGYSSIGDLHFNDLREFDPKTNHWRSVNPSCGVESGPSARRRQCTILVNNKVFLFGGTMPSQSKKSNRTLIDLSDLFVLDFQPSLTGLCAEALIRYGLNERYDHFLPDILRKEICYMHMPNSISKSSKSRIGCVNG